MSQSTQAIILSVIDVMKAMYINQTNEISKKLENIEYINIETLSNKIEKELCSDDLTKNYTKIVEIVESIIQD